VGLLAQLPPLPLLLLLLTAGGLGWALLRRRAPNHPWLLWLLRHSPALLLLALLLWQQLLPLGGFLWVSSPPPRHHAASFPPPAATTATAGAGASTLGHRCPKPGFTLQPPQREVPRSGGSPRRMISPVTRTGPAHRRHLSSGSGFSPGQYSTASPTPQRAPRRPLGRTSQPFRGWSAFGSANSYNAPPPSPRIMQFPTKIKRQHQSQISSSAPAAKQRVSPALRAHHPKKLATRSSLLQVAGFRHPAGHRCEAAVASGFPLPSPLGATYSAGANAITPLQCSPESVIARRPPKGVVATPASGCLPLFSSAPR
jgi:hypothetical protein